MQEPTSAVVVCAYTLERWSDLTDAVRSAAGQDPAPRTVLLVVDHNDELLERARRELLPAVPQLRITPNTRRQGLSGARNTALEQLDEDVIVFLDDDARAADGWLAELLRPYARESVVAVGGAAVPRWSGQGRPATLPAGAGDAWGELDWVVGCTYAGQPTEERGVRNLMGSNMSFRREPLVASGGFDEGLGRIGKTPLGCEETELCIRIRNQRPGAEIVFRPQAVVAHRVSLDRRTWRYLLHRAYAEGVSKAAVAGLVGSDQALETERAYATRVLPSGLARQAVRSVRGGGESRGDAGQGALAIVAVLATTATGYLRGRAARGRSGVGRTPALVLDRVA